MSVNKAIIVGRLGSDPELRFIPSGRAVANFNVATDSVWKDRDGNRQKQTEWHRIVVWGPQAETCSKYLSKGREVYVEGEIRTRSYDDKEGVKRYVTEIIARDVRFLGGAQAGGGRGAGRDDIPDVEPPGNFGGPDPGDDDVPF
jgi:single-strand DNA-binding protein